MSGVLNRLHMDSTKSDSNVPKEHKEEEKGNWKGEEKEKKYEKIFHKDLYKHHHQYDHEMESHVTRKSNPTKSGMALPVLIMPVLPTSVTRENESFASTADSIKVSLSSESRKTVH
jgi:hypothetical protein